MRNLALSLLLAIPIVAQQAVPDANKLVGPKAMCDAAAIKLREAGTDKVVLIMVVGSNGGVESFETEYPKSLKLEKVKEAATAIKKIKLQPATKDGHAVSVMVRATFDCSQQ
jgi:hypothetical protein